MGQPIIYVDVSEIRAGKEEQLAAAMDHLARFVEARMSRVASYAFFVDERRRTMSVVAIHPDSESLEFHLDEGNEEFRKFGELIDLARIEVYGRVSDGVRERLEHKARMLGRGTVTIHEFRAGFAR